MTVNMKLRLVVVVALLACSGMVAAEEKAAAKAADAAPKQEAPAKPDAKAEPAAEAPKLSYAEANALKLKTMGVVSAAEAEAAPAAAAATPADEATALGIAKANNCLACHSIDTKVVGPAWRDVGKKYTGDAEAKARLLAKVKQGGKGVWGEVPMPPNPTISAADLESMVGFILTLQ